MEMMHLKDQATAGCKDQGQGVLSILYIWVFYQYDAAVDIATETLAAETENVQEPWVEWVKRSTHEAERVMAELHLEDWLTTWRRKVWKFAGALVTNSRHKWSYTASAWNPEINAKS